MEALSEVLNNLCKWLWKDGVKTRLHLSAENWTDHKVLRTVSVIQQVVLRKITQNVEHVMLHFRRYKERTGPARKIDESGRTRNVVGILGTTGEGVKVTQEVPVVCLKEVRLYHRI